MSPGRPLDNVLKKERRDFHFRPIKTSLRPNLRHFYVVFAATSLCRLGLRYLVLHISEVLIILIYL